MTALVLGLFGLGGLGIHKFMLGYKKEGLTMLLGSIFTCGFGFAVFTVFSIAEGIIYLTKTDREFDQTYVYQKRGWF